MKSNRKKDMKVVRKYELRKGFASSNSSVTTTPAVVNTILEISDLNMDVNPLRINLVWGVSDDPADENINMAVMWIAKGQTLASDLPGIWRQGTIVADSLNYRTLGTPATVIQTMRRIKEDLDGPDHNLKANLSNVGTRSLVIIADSSTTSSVDFEGYVDVEIEMEQRIFRDDPEDWKGYTFEESVMGMQAVC